MSNIRVEDDEMTVFVVRKGDDVVAVCNNWLDTLRALVLYEIIDIDAVNKSLQIHQNEEYNDLYSLLMNIFSIDEIPDEYLNGGSVVRFLINENDGLRKRCALKFGLKDYLVVLENGDFHKVKATFSDEAAFMFNDEWSNYDDPKVVEVSEYSDLKLHSLLKRSR